jgi:hypothetical protein
MRQPPLTRLATLAALSPGERTAIGRVFGTSPLPGERVPDEGGRVRGYVDRPVLTLASKQKNQVNNENNHHPKLQDV